MELEVLPKTRHAYFEVCACLTDKLSRNARVGSLKKRISLDTEISIVLVNAVL